MSPLDRRQLLTRALGTLGAAGAGAAGGIAIAGGGDAAPAPAAVDTGLLVKVPFDGPKQAGILTPQPAHGTLAALDSVAADRASLASALMALSYRAREMAVGAPARTDAPDAPPPDSGTLGNAIAPDHLSVTIAFGASLFDDRYGLAAMRPAQLERMPVFATDELDPAQSHGDVLLQIWAGHRDTVVHTLRELLREVRGSFELRWNVDGFQSAARGPSPHNSSRNLFAFRDGTGNPDVRDRALMNRLVWTGRGDGEPDWAVGGTYAVARLIRMHVEFWDRVGLREQENMIGRFRDTGAPLGGTHEFQDPRYDLDPHGKRIPLDAHIRLANPRTAETDDQRILRRGLNYSRGFDATGALDQGLVFVGFNRSPAKQFAVVQQRLMNEPMVDYITTFGGGYYFAPPGTGGPAGWIGERLFAA